MGVTIPRLNKPVGPGYFPPIWSPLGGLTDQGVGGCWNSWMTICQSRSSPFAEVRRGRCLSASPFRATGGIKSQKWKANRKDSRSNSVKSRPWRGGGEKKDPHLPSPIRGAQWYNQAEHCAASEEAAEGTGHSHFFFFLHDWGGQRQQHLTATHDSPGFMFPQVCAKCLPKRSSVSTAVCGFVYARACTCSCACVSSSFSFIRCVWSWSWCWGSTAACCFFCCCCF